MQNHEAQFETCSQCSGDSNPRTAFLEILYGCNLHCEYCYIGQQKNHEEPNIPSVAQIEEMAEALGDLDIQEVIFLGGEPLLHPDFDEVCTVIAEKGFESKGIVTNGTLIDDDVIESLKSNGFWANISLRGLDDTFGEITERPELANNLMNGIRRLSSAGVPIGIEYDCTPKTYSEIYDSISRISGEGIDIRIVQLHRILPYGDAQNPSDPQALSIDQWQTVFEQADRLAEEYGIDVIFEDGFPFCLVPEEYWDYIVPCGCGYTSITVGPEGGIRYCSCNPETHGNIITDSKSEVFGKSLNEYRESDHLPTACQSCDLVDECRGGCRESRGEGLEGVDRFSHLFEPIQLEGEELETPLSIYSQNPAD